MDDAAMNNCVHALDFEAEDHHWKDKMPQILEQTARSMHRALRSFHEPGGMALRVIDVDLGQLEQFDGTSCFLPIISRMVIVKSNAVAM